MKDFIKKYATKEVLLGYQKNKLFSNLNIVLASFVLAFWINFLLVDQTWVGEYLKASVINSNVTNVTSDLSINKIENDFYIVSNKNINNITTLSFSLAYNPQNITVTNLNSNIWNVTNLSNTSWISSIILTTQNPVNIKIWDKLVKLNIEKTEDKPESINILNANFKDSEGEQFLFSTSWLTF